MSLPIAVEDFTIKNAQIYQKKLQVEQLQQDMSNALVPLQEQIADVQADYGNQIATKNTEIKTLENEIKELALGI